MMKLLNKRQKSNGGFSLVELIVVIAIMVVLVAVLAPVFTKYIESSRRSTDVQNAASIGESVLADVADNAKWYSDLNLAKGASTEWIEVKSGTPSAIKENIVAKGNAVEKGGKFYFKYNSGDNTCNVRINENANDLNTEAGATAYKNTDN